MNTDAAAMAAGSDTVGPRPATAASRWLMLPGAAQMLPAATAKANGITEGRHRLGLFLLVCGLFGLIVPLEIAADSEMFVSRTIMGIPPHYALTALVFALAVLTDLRYYQGLVARPRVAIGLVCLGFVLAVGVMRFGLRSYLVRSDIYIIRWFFVGFVLMRLATAVGMLRPYLIYAAMVILLTAYAIDVKNTEGGQIDTAIKRVTSSNLWPVINCGTIMIGLLLTVAWPRSWYHAAFGATSFGLLVFAGSIRTSTRSLFAAQALCLVLALLALSRDPRMRGRGQGVRRAATGLAVLGAAFVIFQIVGGNLFGTYSHLGSRFSQTTSEIRIGASRIDEAIDMVRNMQPDEWVIGKGLGGMFYSTLGAWMNVPHVAVLGWLQKGGLVIFVIVLLAVYVMPSVAFFRQLSRPRLSSPLPAPILVVGPMLISWCALTFVSGGIDIGSFLALGGLTALWIQLSEDDAALNACRALSRRRVPIQSRAGFRMAVARTY